MFGRELFKARFQSVHALIGMGGSFLGVLSERSQDLVVEQESVASSTTSIGEHLKVRDAARPGAEIRARLKLRLLFQEHEIRLLQNVTSPLFVEND